MGKLGRIKYALLGREFHEICNNISVAYQKQRGELEAKMQENQRMYGVVQKVFDMMPGAEIIGKSINKEKEEVFIVRGRHNDELYLFGYSYQSAGRLPKVFYKIETDFTLPHPEKFMKIDDFLAVKENVGNGSILMEYLIETAKKNEVRWISGWLSPQDDDNADRREHFYRKHGFNIEGRNIRLDL